MPKDRPPSRSSTTIVSSVGIAIGSSTATAVGTAIKPLPAEHPAYAMIGRVAAEWAQLEHTLDLTIWELANLGPEVGSCITAQMIGHAPRFQAIMALAVKHGLDNKTIGECYTEMNKASNVARKYRNRYVHDAWYVETPRGNINQFKSFTPDERMFGFHRIEESKVETAIAKIITLTNKIRSIKQQLSAQMRSLHGKSS